MTLLDQRVAVFITGISAAGKSTVADLLAARFERGVHVRGDVFRRMIVSGGEDMTASPSPAALRQLSLRYRLGASTTDSFFQQGFSVVVQDVVLGPDLVNYAKSIRARPLVVVVLAPRPEVVKEREAAREKVAYRDGHHTIDQLCSVLRHETPRLGLWLDTSKQTPEETVDEIIRRGLAEGRVSDVDHCAECGFDYELDDAERVAAAIVAGVAVMADLLTRADLDVRSRRQPEVWSPLEYGCHLRDVLLVQRERVLAARRTDTPSFDPMGRDERVEHDGYAQQDPAAVGRQMRDAAAMFANVLGRLGPADWDRTVIYNYPAVLERSLRWVAEHTEHEVQHHLHDVEGQLR